MNRIIFTLTVLLAMLLASCSSDYRDVIPQGSVALISVAPDKAQDESKQIADLLKKSLAVEDIENCGVSLTEKVYMFESADGNFGLCAKVQDYGDLEDVLKNAEEKGLAKTAGERSGCTFYYLGESWVCGFNGNALLIMGPVVASARAQMMQQMVNYLSQDGDEGFTKSKIMKELDTHEGAMAMVVQLNGLPEKEEIQGLLSLGAPKNADASQLFIGADMERKGEILVINGRLSSFNKNTAKAIEDAYAKMGGITDGYASQISGDCVLSFLINSKGADLLPMLQNNAGMMSAMAGINAVIDMNKIISAVDGDMLLQCSSIVQENTSLDLVAKVANDGFMNDVDYWKQSAPQGGVFTQQGQGWYYNSQKDKVAFHFGVSAGQFYCGTEAAMNIAAGKAANANSAIAEAVKGKKIAFVVSLAKAAEGKEGLASMLPVFGSAKTIIYSVGE